MREDRQVTRRCDAERFDSSSVSQRQPRAELPEALPELRREQVSGANDSWPGDPLSVREVATILGCSVWTVRQRCIPQGLPHFRPSRTGKFVFYRNQVVHWLIENQQQRR
jgi:hypothetical protein